MTYDKNPEQTLREGADHLPNEARTCEPCDTALTQPRSGFGPETIRGLYRLARTLPADQGGQHAYNLIELIEGDVLSSKPWGDHPSQQPAHLFRVQLEGLERALKSKAA